MQKMTATPESAARAMKEHHGVQMDAVASTIPAPRGPIPVAMLEMLAEALRDALTALDPEAAKSLPPWSAPKGMKEWTGKFPPNLYVPVMALLTLASKLVPGKGAALAPTPEMFATEQGVSDLVGKLATIARDKAVQDAFIRGADAMLTAPAEKSTDEVDVGASKDEATAEEPVDVTMMGAPPVKI